MFKKKVPRRETHGHYFPLALRGTTECERELRVGA